MGCSYNPHGRGEKCIQNFKDLLPLSFQRTRGSNAPTTCCSFQAVSLSLLARLYS
jgi:hypothetical protein